MMTFLSVLWCLGVYLLILAQVDGYTLFPFLPLLPSFSPSPSYVMFNDDHCLDGRLDGCIEVCGHHCTTVCLGVASPVDTDGRPPFPYGLV